MKNFTRFLAAVLIFTLSSISFTNVDATSATTYTQTFDRKWQFVVTQDAYLPDQTILNLGLKNPSDIHLDKDDNLYIVDSGNRRIVVYNPNIGQVIDIITHPEFSNPQGIFITEDEEIYVADTSAEAVFRLAKDGTFIQKYGKPDSSSLDVTTFNPKKVAVDQQDNLYIVADGVFDGIIQLSSNGDFQGYFSSNKVQLTATQRFQEVIFSDKQLDQLANRNPDAFTNIYVDENGLKYSTSIGDGIDNVKKHNTDGSSSIDTNYGIDLQLIDVYTDNDGIIYAASASGFIDVFTKDGSFIFAFGTDFQGADVSGIYSELTSIAVDSNGYIWTLDQDKAFLQSYVPTDYSTLIYKALTQYQDGDYDGAVLTWEEVLKLNQLSVLAHNQIGHNLFSQGEFEASMEHFELGGSRKFFSDAYWEVRNLSIQKNLPPVLLGIIVVTLVSVIVKFTNKRFQYLAKPKAYVKKIGEIKIINDFIFQFSFYKKPLDSYYYLKRKERGSYLMASIIFVLFFFVYMNFTMNQGFIFQRVEAADMDLGAIVLGFFAIFVLFIISNYLVTSINDGEGSLGEIYKGVMYSLSPLMISYLLITYLSYYVTLNEVILLDLIGTAGLLGTGILIFLAIQELHNYTIRESIKSFLLTFLFMAIAAILFAFIQIMGDQLIQFVIGLFKEAFRNVLN